MLKMEFVTNMYWHNLSLSAVELKLKWKKSRCMNYKLKTSGSCIQTVIAQRVPRIFRWNFEQHLQTWNFHQICYLEKVFVIWPISYGMIQYQNSALSVIFQLYCLSVFAVITHELITVCVYA